MQLTPYLDQLRGELDRATALADEPTRQTAVRLADSLDAALRLSYQRLLTDAAAELTAALDDRVVEVRLEGDQPVLVVTAAEASAAEQPHAPSPDDRSDEAEGTARITLRLPETLKTRADQSADTQGVSLNTWIVSACRAALTAPATRPRTPNSRRYSGWA